MTAELTSMTRELDDLIRQQIHTLKQDAIISDAELQEYSLRSKRIGSLCRALNQGSSQTWAENQSSDSSSRRMLLRGPV